MGQQNEYNLNDLKENLVEKKEEKNSSFFGKMGNMFNKAKSHIKGTIKEMNFPEIKQTLSEQTKVAAVAFKDFGKDISRDINVFIIK